MNTSKVNRVEVIDHTKSVENGGGRVYVFREDAANVKLHLQDAGRTLKVFIDKQGMELKQLISEQQERNRDGILYCEEEANRGVLLSDPPQYKCKRDGCYQTWVVGTNPPICKMFDYKKHLDTRTTDSFNAGALAMIGEVIELVNRHDPMANKKSNPNYWGNTLRKDLTTLEAKIKDV